MKFYEIALFLIGFIAPATISVSVPGKLIHFIFQCCGDKQVCTHTQTMIFNVAAVVTAVVLVTVAVTMLASSHCETILEFIRTHQLKFYLC